MIKAVIFDVGGVFFYTMDAQFERVFTKYFRINHLNYKKTMALLVPKIVKGEISEDVFWQEFRKITGTEILLPEESLWVEPFKKYHKQKKGTWQILKELKENGMNICVLSDTIKPHYKINLESGFYNNFDEKVISCEVGLKKPDPEIYKLALKKLRLRPREVIFIDNQRKNIIASRKLGIKSFLFRTPGLLRKNLIGIGLLNK